MEFVGIVVIIFLAPVMRCVLWVLIGKISVHDICSFKYLMTKKLLKLNVSYFYLAMMYVLILVTNNPVIALVLHGMSRFAYIAFVSSALRDIHASEAVRWDEFIKFRRSAKVIMNNDAFTFVLLCLVTRHSPVSMVPVGVQIAGGLFVLIGAYVKIWSAKLIGDGYFWVDFFAPPSESPRCRVGPYRYLNNPMYTVGYLPAYGCAMLLGSWVGVAVAAIDQIVILFFNYKVELPHFKKLSRCDSIYGTEEHRESKSRIL